MADNLNDDSQESDNFDEKAEIEKLQEKIKRMSDTSGDSGHFMTGNPDLLNDDEIETTSPEDILAPFLSAHSDNEDEQVRAKKYVVTADVDNVEFFEGLSVEERSSVFNEILAEYIKNEDKIKGKKKIKKAFVHMFIIALTLVIALPLLLFIVNASIHFTVLNYQHAQANFEKLYESHGVPTAPKKRR